MTVEVRKITALDLLANEPEWWLHRDGIVKYSVMIPMPGWEYVAMGGAPCIPYSVAGYGDTPTAAAQDALEKRNQILSGNNDPWVRKIDNGHAGN